MIVQVVSSLKTKGCVGVFQKKRRVQRIMAHMYLAYCKMFGMERKYGLKRGYWVWGGVEG